MAVVNTNVSASLAQASSPGALSCPLARFARSFPVASHSVSVQPYSTCVEASRVHMCGTD